MSAAPGAEAEAGVAAGARTSKLVQQYRLLRAGIFSSFQIMKRKEESPLWRSALDKILEALQIISFAVASDAGFKWNSRVIQSISILTNVTILPPSLTGPLLYLAMFFLAMAWCLLVLGLFVWSSVSFMKGGVQRIWPLRLLAVLGSLSSGFLFIPVTSSMLSVYTCGGYEKHPMWSQSGFDCFSGGHLVLVIVSSIILATFIGVVACFTLLFFESNLLDEDLNAKSHGRADTVQLMVKLLLVVCVTHFSRLIGVGALVVILVICGLLCMANYAFFMPYLRHGVNQFMVASSALQAWFAICLAFTQLYEGYDAATTLYLGIPPVILMGLWVTNYRTNNVLHTPASKMSNAYQVDFKVRLLLHTAVYGHPTKRLTPRQLERRVTLLERLAARKDVGSEGDESEDEGLNIPQEEVNLLRKAKAGISSTALSDEDSSRELFNRLLSVIPSYLLDGVEDIYRDAIERFRSSSMALVFAARYYSKWRANRHLEMMYLAHAEKRSPFLDARYLIHLARSGTGSVGSGNGGDVSALSRVTFETYLRAARKHMLACLGAQAAFWAELREPVPDISTLQRHTRTMLLASQSAEKSFGELMTLNSSSLVVLRLYAQFNLLVANNPDKAQVILAEAERMDEQQAKDQAGESSVIRIMEIAKVDVMADNTAVVTLGATSSNLGTILSCNAMTCRMFGYSRWQLERRNVKMLVPDPIAGMHDGFLRSFLETGVGKVVDYTRVVFGLHKSGLIFPMVLAVREQPSVDGPATFVGIMRPLNTQEHHMLLGADMRLHCFSAASAALLDLEPSQLQEAPRFLSDYVPNLEAYLARLKLEKGCIIPVSTLRATKLVQMRREATQGVIGSDGRVTMTGMGMGTMPAAGAGTGALGGMPPGGTMGKLGGPGTGVGFVPGGMGMGTMGGMGTTPLVDTDEDELTFIHAHLQSVTVRNGTELLVVHWTHARKAAGATTRRHGSAAEDEEEGDDSEGAAGDTRSDGAFSNRAAADDLDDAFSAGGSQRPPAGHPPVGADADARGCPFMINVGVLDKSRKASAGSGKAPAVASPSAATPLASPPPVAPLVPASEADDETRDALADVLMDLVNGEETRAAAAADGLVIGQSSSGSSASSGALIQSDRTEEGPVAVLGRTGGASASSETALSPIRAQAEHGLTKGRSTARLQAMLPNILALREGGEEGSSPTKAAAETGPRFANVVQQALTSPHVEKLRAEAEATKTARRAGATQRTVGGDPTRADTDKDAGMRGSAFEKGTRISGPGGKSSSMSSRRNLARRIQDRLRRIMADNLSELLPSLRLLKLMSLAVTLGTIALGISLSSLLVTSIKDDLLTVAEVDRAASAFMAATSINSDVLALRVSTRILPSLVKPVLAEIKTLSTIMDVNVRQLFEIADLEGMTELYTEPTVSILGNPGTDEGSPPTAGGTGAPATLYRRLQSTNNNNAAAPSSFGAPPPASLDSHTSDLLTAGLVYATASSAYASTVEDYVASGAAAATGCTRFGAALNASIGQEFSPAFLLGPGEGLPLRSVLGHRLYGQTAFLLMNGGPGASLQQTVNVSMMEWHNRAILTLEEVRVQSRALYAGFAATIAVVTLVLYVPLLVHIDRIKVEYVMPLLSLPAKVANHLRRIADRDLKRLDVSDDAEEAGESDSDPEKRIKDLEDDEAEQETDAFGSASEGPSPRAATSITIATAAPRPPPPPITFTSRKGLLQPSAGAGDQTMTSAARSSWVPISDPASQHLDQPLPTDVTLAAAAEGLTLREGGLPSALREGGLPSALRGGSRAGSVPGSLPGSRSGSVIDYAGIEASGGSNGGVVVTEAPGVGSVEMMGGTTATDVGSSAELHDNNNAQQLPVALPVSKRHSATAVHPWPPAGVAPITTLRSGGAPAVVGVAAPAPAPAAPAPAPAAGGRYISAYGTAKKRKGTASPASSNSLGNSIPSAFWLSRFVSNRSGTSSASGSSSRSARLAAQMGARRFKRSMRNLMVLLGKFLIGPLAAVIFLTILYLVYALVSSQATTIITLATASHLRTADILAYQAALGYVFGLPITGTTEYLQTGNETSRYLRANAIKTLNDAAASLWYHNQLLTYGAGAPPGFEDAVRGAIGASSFLSDSENARIKATVFGDACLNMFSTHNLVSSLTAASMLGHEPDPALFDEAIQGLTTTSMVTSATTPSLLGSAAVKLNQPPPATVATGASCRTIADGVLTRGLSAGIASLLTQGTKLAKLAQTYLDGTSTKPGLGPSGHTSNVTTVLEACMAPDVVPAGWSSPTPSRCGSDLLNFMVLSQRFAAPISDGITHAFFAQQFASMAQISAFSIAFTIVCLLIFLAYHFVVFTPMVVRANRDIKEQRAMFLVLPASTIERLPKLRALLLNIVEGEESNGRKTSAPDSEGSDSGTPHEGGSQP